VFAATAAHGARHHSVIADLFGWGLVALLGYLVFRFIRGQRNKEAQRAAAWAAALSAVVADIRTTVDAAATAHSGSDARSAVAVNLGQSHDIDELAAAVAHRLGAVSGTGLSDQYDYEHEHDQHDRARNLPTADREGRRLDPVGIASRALPSGAASVVKSRRAAREGVRV